MSYLPFHHKYRPQTFADLVGQEAIAATLTNALRLGKVAPAYLFTGPRGTGKTSSARIFAKSLNCTASPVPTALPCGQCGVCRSISAGNALDAIEIDAASNTGVDNIRELIERAQYAPVQCRYKVYTIDECHMLSTAAFNSLLKTLEEPPPRVVFILATTDPQRVLPTIISRCQKFDYRRIPLEAMVGHLTYIAQNEGMSIDPAALRLVAQIAQGGLRDAESLLDQLSLVGEQVTIDRVWDLVGSVPERDLLGICTALHQRDLTAVLDRCRQLLERGKEPLTVLQNLTGFYRDLSIAKAAPQRSDLTTLTTETWQQLVALAAQIDLATILSGQQRLKESEAQLKGSTQPHLWLEISLLALLPIELATPSVQLPVTLASEPARPQQSITDAAPALVTTQAVSNHQPTPIADISIAPEIEAVDTPATDTYDLPRIWQQVLQQLLPSGKGLFTPHGVLLSIDENLAIVGMKSSIMSKIAEGQKPHLQKVLTAILDRPIMVTIQLIGNTKTNQPAFNNSPSPAISQSVAPPVADLVAPVRVVADLPGEILEEVDEVIAEEAPSTWSNPNTAEPSIVAEEALSLSLFDQSIAAQPQSPAPEFVAIPVSQVEPPEPVMTIPDSFTIEELDAAAINLAKRFGGEVVEEYVTLWDL